MKDFLGKVIGIGDIIVLARGSALLKGVVVGFTVKKVCFEIRRPLLFIVEELQTIPSRVVVIRKASKLIGTGQPPAHSEAVRALEDK